MPEETLKKIYIYGSIVIIVFGIIFMIFALFLNRGTITVEAEAPFNLQLSNIQNKYCANSPCEITIAPGEYTAIISKSGYKDYEFTAKVPIGGNYPEKAELEYIATIEEDPSLTPEVIFSEPDYKGDQLQVDKIFGEEKFVTYLKMNPETQRQTLYYRELANGTLGEELVATSFIRTVTDYKIIPFIEKQSVIFLIEYSETGSAMYLIDLNEKSRTKIASSSYINSVQWLPGTDQYFYDARNPDTGLTNIYLYNPPAEETTMLQLQTGIENVIAFNNTTLFAAINSKNLEFIKYNLTTGNIKKVTELPGPAISKKIKLNETKDTVYSLIDGKIFKIQLTAPTQG